MGGLRKKMPITACTMLIGVIAICGLAVPGVSLWGYKIAFSGYHSKDAIVATAMTYAHLNPAHSLLFLAPLVTAGITAFYMFRLWFYTFAGEPRDQELYDHCHESPRVMTVPLMILAFFAIFCAVGGEGGPLYTAISHSETIPEHIADSAITLPSHKQIAGYHQQAGILALLVAAVQQDRLEREDLRDHGLHRQLFAQLDRWIQHAEELASLGHRLGGDGVLRAVM